MSVATYFEKSMRLSKTNVMREKSINADRHLSIPLSYRIIEAKVEHGQSIYEVICHANDFDPSELVPGVMGLEKDWQNLLQNFPQGQFVALANIDGVERVIGLAIAMRTSRSPSEKPLGWRDMIGDLGLRNHDAKGQWLYGVEKAVHPDFQGLGIGSALYKAQFELVKRLALKGIYAGGMLKGYKHHKDTMSIREYGGKVMRGEIFDATVSVQMKKGFKPRTLIENYVWDHQANHTGMLIVWEAPRQTQTKVFKPSIDKHAAIPAYS
jgi:GNAT superfamily N-acetyltransferase